MTPPKFLVLVLAASHLTGCAEPTTPASVPTAFTISGNEQVRFPGTTLPNLITVQLVNTEGDFSQTAGVPVSWTVLEGGGTIAPTGEATSVIGRARAEWTLSPNVGTNLLQVRVGSLPASEVFTEAVLPGPIAFVTAMAEGTEHDISRINIATGGATNLTNGIGINWHPSWRW